MQRERRGEMKNKITALLVRSNNEIMQYMENNFGYIATCRSHRRYFDDAREIGKKDGKNISIGKAVEGQQKDTKLIRE